MPNAPTTSDKKPADVRWGFAFGVDGVLTMKETCAALKTSRQTVWRLSTEGRIRQGNLRGPGTSVRYCKRSVDRFIQSLEA
jgi:predicted DNA-binding transcriptional regulator AlpA